MQDLYENLQYMCRYSTPVKKLKFTTFLPFSGAIYHALHESTHAPLPPCWVMIVNVQSCLRPSPTIRTLQETHLTIIRLSQWSQCLHNLN